MSYIKYQLGVSENSMLSNREIYNFLVQEGFKKERNPFYGEDCMRFVASNNYTVWFCIHDGVMRLYAEYDCGGTTSETEFNFNKYDWHSFRSKYFDAVKWLKDALKNG